MSGKTPAQSSVSLVENQPFVDIRNARQEEVTLDSTTRDDGNTPTSQLRKGLIVAQLASGKFIDAADGSAPANVAAFVDSSEAADGDWPLTTITSKLPKLGVSVSVTLGGADNTSALVVAALNADPSFRNYFLASVQGVLVRITALLKGQRLQVTSSLATAFGASGQSSNGTFTKHGILASTIPSLLGIADAAEDRNATVITENAIVREANLFGLSEDGRLWFAQHGIQLV
jgi:hypothetical protein